MLDLDAQTARGQVRVEQERERRDGRRVDDEQRPGLALRGFRIVAELEHHNCVLGRWHGELSEQEEPHKRRRARRREPVRKTSGVASMAETPALLIVHRRELSDLGESK